MPYSLFILTWFFFLPFPHDSAEAVGLHGQLLASYIASDRGQRPSWIARTKSQILLTVSKA